MNAKRKIPFTLAQIKGVAARYPTPFYVYDEVSIRKAVRNLYECFSWNEGFREYFPIKAVPNQKIIRILKEEGCFADCCSVPELMIAEKVGLSGEGIMLTSNDTSDEEFKKARSLGAIINLDDPSHFNYLKRLTGLPKILCLRYNPGPINKKGKLTWKHLKDDKFGMRKDQLFETYSKALKSGVKRFGLHMMIMSNDLQGEHLFDTAKICMDIAIELRKKTGINLEFIDLGGGVGIPYKPDQKSIDMKVISEKIRNIYINHISKGDIAPLSFFVELGRYLVGQHGYLVTTVRHVKNTYKSLVGLDASMADLIRPGMYGSYHHLSVLGSKSDKKEVCDVVGSMCENIDKFAVDRRLPIFKKGDIVVVHDVGTYGRGKGFDFNGKLRCGEFLLSEEGSFKQIRRAETVDDYFATIVE